MGNLDRSDVRNMSIRSWVYGSEPENALDAGSAEDRRRGLKVCVSIGN